MMESRKTCDAHYLYAVCERLRQSERFRAAETVSPRALSWFVSGPTSQQQVETSLRSERHGDDVQPAGKETLDGATGKDG